ncbi:MAG TPA: isocitrate/isopropylmalate family dehydrogenase [Planctomycetota bacterium]|jgi:isocitrate dehydrogenase (NAD+)|nr:isocitrate/isopropylmalate family dehydrogenase [Planctomycetota bacterium]
MKTHRVVELLGDGISPELSVSVRSVVEALPCRIEWVPVDLSETNRKARGNAVYDEAVAAMRDTGVALKYPTATTGESPNKILRDRCQFAVIHRPVCTLPGIANNFKKTIDIDVVRIATGGTYEDAGRRIGRDTAVSLRVIERAPCRFAARFAFKLAMIRGTNVTSTSKYTIQRETDGLFEEVVGQVAEDYPSIPFRRELFDSLLAGIIMNPEKYAVIVCPNEYGDFLSDTACGLVGSIGLGDSSSYAFDDDGKITLAMFDPAGGTAPDIAGKNLANPTASLLSLANLLRHLGEVDTGRALRRALLETIAAGRGTRDVGGNLGTKEFTAEVAGRTRSSPAPA